MTKLANRPGSRVILLGYRWAVRRGKEAVILLAISCFVAVCSAAPAGAAMTFGSALADPPDTPSVCGPSTWATTSLQGTVLTSPIDGVIVSWKVRGSGALDSAFTQPGASVALRVLRLASGGAYTAVGRSGSVPLPLTDAVVGPNPTRLEVHQGDLLGVTPRPDAWVKVARGLGREGKAVRHDWIPDLADGETRAPSTGKCLDGHEKEIMVNAVVEPDADHDGYGDETQDPCPTVPGTAPCPPPPPADQPPAATPHVPPASTRPVMTTPDRVPPSIRSLAASPATFRLGTGLPAFARLAPVGTTIRFVLNEPAWATATFSPRETCRLAGGRCVSRTRANRLRPRCTITHVRGRLVFSAHVGQNQIRFQGRVSKARTLAPGPYRLTITARDSAGNESQPTSTRVAIVR
jgi:hypothetical protein